MTTRPSAETSNDPPARDTRAHYSVRRLYFNRPGDDSEVIIRRCTLERAQAHCSDPETSSGSCTNADGLTRTERDGPWFDCYIDLDKRR